MKQVPGGDDHDKMAFATAYSSPNSGSLESVMTTSTDGSSSVTPPPTRSNSNVNRYMDNLQYAWCFNADPAMNNHKIAKSPSFDVFCTDRLCTRRSKTPENANGDNFCCSLSGLSIAAGVLIATAECFVFAITVYAIAYCIQRDGNWDIGGVIIGAAIVHTVFAVSFMHGLAKRRLKFLLPVTFQTILVFVAGCGALMVALFTSFSDRKISDNEWAEHLIFCVLLAVVVWHQLALFVVSTKIYRLIKNA
uniref:MARVEL domain-containing protein n=1 Tax=Panagrellus redivivus TaxID=6233 RepID=A0A7E4VF27_PANRE